MNLKFILPAFMAVWMLNPILSSAQSITKNKVENSDPQRSGFVYLEKKQSETELKEELDNYRTKLITIKNNFDNWKLTEVSVEKSNLVANLSNFQQLNEEAKQNFGKNTIYVEGNGHALLASESGEIKPFFFGNFTENNNTLSLFHKVVGCDNCSKNYTFSRMENGNQLVLKLSADDESLSDVTYLLTFTK